MNLVEGETSFSVLETAAFRKQLGPIWCVLQGVCDMHLNSCSEGACCSISNSVERNILACNYQKDQHFIWGAQNCAYESPQCLYNQDKGTFGYPCLWKRDVRHLKSSLICREHWVCIRTGGPWKYQLLIPDSLLLVRTHRLLTEENTCSYNSQGETKGGKSICIIWWALN